MELYWRVIKLRPKVSNVDFSISDDGTGPIISRWDSKEAKPTDAEIASVDDSKPTWIVAQEEIKKLESLETPRRLAESVLSDAGKTWLTSNREKIAIERAKLKG